VLSELHSLNLMLCSKKYNKKFVLQLIVAPQLSSGLWHKYSSKTRQADQANEQSMGIPDEKFNNIGTSWDFFGEGSPRSWSSDAAQESTDNEEKLDRSSNTIFSCCVIKRVNLFECCAIVFQM
jgi:hypothetical protein